MEFMNRYYVKDCRIPYQKPEIRDLCFGIWGLLAELGAEDMDGFKVARCERQLDFGMKIRIGHYEVWKDLGAIL